MTHIQETYSVAIEGMFTLRRLHACPRVRPRAGLYRRGWFWELKWIEWNIAYRLVWTGAPPPHPWTLSLHYCQCFHPPSCSYFLSLSIALQTERTTVYTNDTDRYAKHMAIIIYSWFSPEGTPSEHGPFIHMPHQLSPSNQSVIAYFSPVNFNATLVIIKIIGNHR